MHSKNFAGNVIVLAFSFMMLVLVALFTANTSEGGCRVSRGGWCVQQTAASPRLKRSRQHPCVESSTCRNHPHPQPAT